MKSKFMDFLDNINDNIVNETYVDEPVEESPQPKKINRQKKKIVTKSIKKDSSVKLIEARLRVKLDGVGLNETAIDDVVSYVLEDVQKIAELVASKKTAKPTPEQKKHAVQEQKTSTVVGRAEYLLSDEPYNGHDAPVIAENQSQPERSTNTSQESQPSNMSSVADKASSLLS